MKKGPLSNFLNNSEGLSTGLVKLSRLRREQDREQLEISLAHKPRENDHSRRLKLEYRSIAELHPASRQVRRHSKKHIGELMNSTSEFDFCGVVLITSEELVIDGHAMIEASKALGIQEVPCLVVDHLSPTEIKRLRIALNRLQEKGEWNFETLTLELQELELKMGSDLHIPGVELAEIDILLQPNTSKTDDDKKLPPLSKEVVSRLGDVWLLGQSILAHADARSQNIHGTLIGREAARLNISDPPYNVPIKGHVTSGNHDEFVMASGEMSKTEFFNFLVECLETGKAHLKDGELAMYFMDWRGLHVLLAAADKVGFDLLNIVVWVKTNAGMGSLYRSQHEFIVVLKNGIALHVNNVQLGRFGRHRSNVWHHAGASSLGSEARKETAAHPTPKPTMLLEDAIMDVTNRGDLVVDNFVGSGSTLIACENTGRRFFGTELEGCYVDLTLKRWSTMTGQNPILQETGETFAQVHERRRSSPQ